jgi:hypothetical protein
MSNLTKIAQPHGTSMPAICGYEKPGLPVWRQQSAQLVMGVFGVDARTRNNSRSVSQVEHRRT